MGYVEILLYALIYTIMYRNMCYCYEYFVIVIIMEINLNNLIC